MTTSLMHSSLTCYCDHAGQMKQKQKQKAFIPVSFFTEIELLRLQEWPTQQKRIAPISPTLLEARARGTHRISTQHTHMICV